MTDPEEAHNEPTLSEEQRKAVESDAEALVVVASAGSGKTEVVARRIQRLLLSSPDDDGRILALTYTVKAADELRERLDNRLGELSRRVDSETVHGFCHALLRTHGTRIGLPVEPELLTRDEDRVEFFRSWLDEQGITFDANLLELLRSIDLARARDAENEHLDEWNDALSENGALDFPSLLTRSVELLEVPSVRRQVRRIYTSVVVDEAQNLTKAQYLLLYALCAEDGSTVVPTMLVGDDKQSIVSFAGADPALISQFSSDFQAERHTLTQNFRSARVIASAASRVAKELGHSYSEEPVFAADGRLELQASNSEVEEGEYVAEWISKLLDTGLPRGALSDTESDSVQPEEIAVLTRSSTALRWVASSLESRGIAFSKSSSPNDWLSTDAGRVVLELVALKAAPSHRSTYLQLGRLLESDVELDSPEMIRDHLKQSDDRLIKSLITIVDLEDVASLLPALRRIQAPQDVSDTESANWTDDVTLLDGCWSEFDSHTARGDLTWASFKLHCARTQRGDDLSHGVRLLTVHKSQGREFSAVAIIGLNEGQFPDFRAKSAADKESELRTFYVAVTRSRRVLLLSRSMLRDTRYGPRATEPSSFLPLVS